MWTPCHKQHSSQSKVRKLTWAIVLSTPQLIIMLRECCHQLPMYGFFLQESDDTNILQFRTVQTVAVRCQGHSCSEGSIGKHIIKMSRVRLQTQRYCWSVREAFLYWERSTLIGTTLPDNESTVSTWHSFTFMDDKSRVLQVFGVAISWQSARISSLLFPRGFCFAPGKEWIKYLLTYLLIWLGNLGYCKRFSGLLRQPFYIA